MMFASSLESAGMLLAILAPLLAVPLTVITFYLRSLREHQLSWHSELMRRLEAAEASVNDLRKTITELERDFTTKEEWLRECMLARHALVQLTETTVRIETKMQSFSPRSDTVSRAERARIDRDRSGRRGRDGPYERGEDDR